jgi:hypothetical protein
VQICASVAAGLSPLGETRAELHNFRSLKNDCSF